MRKKRSDYSSKNQDEGRGKRTCARSSDDNVPRSFSSITSNSVTPVTRILGSSITNNDIEHPQSTTMCPLSQHTTPSVLCDITNTTRKSPIIDNSCSGLTSVTRKSNITDVNRLSVSVNQKKVHKRSFSSSISQVASNLTIRIDQQYETKNSEFNQQQSDNSTVLEEVQELVNGSYKTSYLDDGDACHECCFCGAQMWFAESLKSVKKNSNPQFGMCCSNGKVIVPLLKNAPEELANLYFRKQSSNSKNFLKNIRSYNNMFCFTSMGGKINHSINANGGGPYSFVLSGQNHHLIGSLLPTPGNPPVYAQLYIYDTDNEVSNRISSVTRHAGHEHLDAKIVEMLKECLDKHNCVVKNYRKAADIIKENVIPDVGIRLLRNNNSNVHCRQYNMPIASELAALIVGDFDNSYTKRDIIVKRQSGHLQRIDELHMAYLPLQYPLFFPFGDNGYDSTNDHAHHSLTTTKKKKKLTPREYLAFRLMSRNSEQSVILHGKKLLQQFIVDGYSMVESDRLDYIRKHQKELRVDLYSGLSDAVTRGETDPSSTGRRVILPSSFTGGARYMIQNYQDAMAICAWAGYPDIFITFTCNPMWPEIIRHCEKDGLKPCDKPEVLSRVFHIKLRKLMRTLKDDKIFGSVKAEVYTIEFQKRGLPHAHIILWLADTDKITTPFDVDKLISAEIPDRDTDPELYDLVGSFMIHGPCGRSAKSAPCMKDGKCSKYFPKKYNACTMLDENGYPTYRRRADGRVVSRKGVHLDNRFVVPYNPILLKLFSAHLNIEKTNQSRAVKYLFKYISKGNDRVIAGIYNTNDSPGSQQTFDEISHYLNCRYVSSCEGSWRIFGFDIHHRYPPVERLSFHLPHQQSIYYSQTQSMASLVNNPRVKESMFIAWLQKNTNDPFARTLTYSQFPNYFTFVREKRIWKLRERGFSVGRLGHCTPVQGELYYLRLLLTKVRGPKNYEDIRTVNNVVYPTFREACYVLGLLDDDNEYIDAIKEASLWASGTYLRLFFTSMLLSHSLTQPAVVWERTKEMICEDLLYIAHGNQHLQDLQFSSANKEAIGLFEIQKLLLRNGKSLDDYPSMPRPSEDNIIDMSNQLILQELNFNKQRESDESNRLQHLMTDEQKKVFNHILCSIYSEKGGFFFLHGYGGTGKTFIWNALTASIRSKGGIILNVASSGIAATLLPSGRTAHSRFSIPIDINEDSMCSITHASPTANLIKAANLIIWDEAPMIRRHCVEAFDRTLRDLMKKNSIFGGKCVVMGGDFRQILPVIPKSGRAEIVYAAINSSPLWKQCTILQLTKNMRLRSSDNRIEQEKLKSFSEWLLLVGDGIIGLPHDGTANVTLPADLLLYDDVHPMRCIIDATYPNLVERIFEKDYLNNRSILTPTTENVNCLNEYICSLLPGDAVEYFSADSINRIDNANESFDDLYDTEYLNSLKCSGMPHHKLVLKVGVPVMLIRNIDQASGLCNGTRLQVTQLGKNVIKAKALNGTSVGEDILIHRMDMNPSESKLPFKMTRRQFPIIISFAMTINKSQGQSMTNVGLYLPSPVFSHGQLYVALSRVKSFNGLKILILDEFKKCTNTTVNVVYREVFQNLMPHPQM